MSIRYAQNIKHRPKMIANVNIPRTGQAHLSSLARKLDNVKL